MSARSFFVARGTMQARARMRGLSLIELMIAMTISLIVLAAVGWVYQGTMQTYRSHDAISRLQEGARYAFEVIGRDLRMAGSAGCGYQTSKNVLTDIDTEWYKDFFRRPISSVNQDGTADEDTEFSDALRILQADVTREYIVDSHSNVGGQFNLTAANDFSEGQLLLATDCNHAAVFQASSGAGEMTIGHIAGGENDTGDLGNTYMKGSRVYKLKAVDYYVAENAAGVPSLFRQTPQGAAAALTPEELVEGVEDLRVTFGVDTSDPKDGQADYYDDEKADFPYVSGEWISDDTHVDLGADEAARWSRVVSVRISLLMRTVEDRVIPTPQAYTYNGVEVAAADAKDRRLRKVFTHVIKLRNR
jgi:type IV pilus assembly protein PilW